MKAITKSQFEDIHMDSSIQIKEVNKTLGRTFKQTILSSNNKPLAIRIINSKGTQYFGRA